MDNSSSDSNNSKRRDSIAPTLKFALNSTAVVLVLLLAFFRQQRVAFLERAESCESARFETVRDDDFYITLSLSKLSLNERLPGARETHRSTHEVLLVFRSDRFSLNFTRLW